MLRSSSESGPRPRQQPTTMTRAVRNRSNDEAGNDHAVDDEDVVKKRSSRHHKDYEDDDDLLMPKWANNVNPLGEEKMEVGADDTTTAASMPEKGVLFEDPTDPREQLPMGRDRLMASKQLGQTTSYRRISNYASASTISLRERVESRNAEEQSRGRRFLAEISKIPDESHWAQEWNWKKPISFIRRMRLLSGKIVEHPTVQLAIICLIVLNAFLMGVATFNFVTEDPQVQHIFDISDRVFLSIFTAELLLQIIYRGLSLFTDGWLVFDFVIVVVSWSLESLQIIRAFRIFRAFRLIVRLGPLRALVMSLGAVMPRLYAIGMLLLLIFYIYAVLFTELFGDLDLSEKYFKSLDFSLFTCLQMMTLEWSDITREVMMHKSWGWAPITSYIAVTGFIVFNLIIAVVCDAVAVVEQQVKAEEQGEKDTDKKRLEFSQERIYELSNGIEDMKSRQREMQSAIRMLAGEIRSAVPLPSAATLAAHRQSIMKKQFKHADSTKEPTSSSPSKHPPSSLRHPSTDILRSPTRVSSHRRASHSSIVLSPRTPGASRRLSGVSSPKSSPRHRSSPVKDDIQKPPF